MDQQPTALEDQVPAVVRRLLKVEEITIPKGDPFANDRLDRKAAVENVASLLSSISQPFVLAINGPWGSGKTTFVRMLSKVLAKNGPQPALFSAWEYDFVSDPLVPLMAEMEKAFEPILEKDGKALLKKVRETGVKFLKGALPLAVRLATSGVVNLPAGADEVIGGAFEKLTEAEIDSLKAKSVLQEFRETLQEVVNEVQRENPHPVVIIIDELDRCRPTFAIELLERIKHLFGVPGIVFVLAIDRKQLEAAVRGVYGAEVDTDGYLRRFIDLNYRLPPSMSFKGFCEGQWAALEIGQAVQENHPDIPVTDLFGTRMESTVPGLFGRFVDSVETLGLSLRQVQQCSTELAVILRTWYENDSSLLDVVPQLIAIRAALPDVYEKLVGDRVMPIEELEGVLGTSARGRRFLISESGFWLLAYWAFSEKGFEAVKYWERRSHSPKGTNGISPTEAERLQAISSQLLERHTQTDTLPMPPDELVELLELAHSYKAF